jgi:hypothetical protein
MLHGGLKGSAKADSDDEEMPSASPRKQASPRNPVAAPLPLSAADRVEVFSESPLESIAEDIQALENAIRDAEARKIEEWDRTVAPTLRRSIASWESELASLRAKSSLDDDEHYSSMDELISKVEGAKRELYLPWSAIKLGNEGIYFGFNDFWLDEVSGSFLAEMQPTMGTDSGRLVFALSGLPDAVKPGVTARFKFGSCLMLFCTMLN